MVDIKQTMQRLRDHVSVLTVDIGERSVTFPNNLARSAAYIEETHRDLGIGVAQEPYRYGDMTVANVVAEIRCGEKPARHFLLGAHYDSVCGTVGADDNASAVAVLLETARCLKALVEKEPLSLVVKCVAFVLEEPPTFGTRYMGSRIYAKNARRRGEPIDGMLCLEMVGYTCHEPGCQDYPFPLMFMGYPDTGNFIGIVGNLSSRVLTESVVRAFRQNRDLPVEKATIPCGGWLVPAVRLSDHSSFWDQGYKAVMITDTAFMRNPHYHHQSDTMDKLDFRFMAELVESLLIFFRSEGART